jgi:putative MATE family efflux protein
VFRAAGNAQIAMRVLWAGNVVNLILDPLLIFGVGPFPELGVTGAAVATVTARSFAVVLQFAVLASGTGRIAIARRHLRLEPDKLLAMVRLSGSAVVQNLIGMASWIGLMRILATFGDAALAGYTICIRIVIFALLPSWGMSNAAATLVGQNLGAKQPDRAQRSVMIAGLYNMVFLGCVGLVFLAAAGPLTAVFTGDVAVQPIAAQALRIISLGFVMYAWGMVLAQSFNGAGDTRTPTLLNLLCFWLLELPLAWSLSKPLGLGPAGVFWSVAIAFSAYAIVGFAVFRRGRWRSVRV